MKIAIAITDTIDVLITNDPVVFHPNGTQYQQDWHCMAYAISLLNLYHNGEL